MKPKPVMVIWLDNCVEGMRWTDREDREKPTPMHCVTVGFVAAKTKKCIRVVQSISGHKGRSSSGSTVILRRNIISICKLEWEK